MNITVIEANMTSLQHSVINRLIITMLSEMKNIDKINLYCSKSHYEAINYQSNKIIFHEIFVLPPGKHRVLKFFFEYVQSRHIIRKSGDSLIYFLSCFPNVHYFLSKRNFHKNKKILITTHGEAEGLIMKGKWKIWSYPFWISRTFKVPEKANLYRLVLGKSIYDNINDLYSFKNLFHIEHPYEDFKNENIVSLNDEDISFAFVGNCLEKKGGISFLNAANSCSAKFVVIGAYDLNIEDVPNNLKILSHNHQMLSYDDFNEAMNNITYACYPYPANSYKFTASGAIFDAIKYLKPIVYIKNDYFDNILKDAGNIGYRCENEEDFINTIKKISQLKDNNVYSLQVMNLKRLQSKFSYESILTDLQEIVMRIMNSEVQ